jgi:hypothetical protein
MNLVFDGLSQPIGFAMHSLFGLIPLALWGWERYVRKRPAHWFFLLMAALLLVGVNAIRIWDQTRVRNMARSGAGLHVTDGVITQSWHIVTRRRDWTRSWLSYTSTTSEGFDIGNERFSWNVGDNMSPATFSNAGSAPLKFHEGMTAEVTWFNDAADNDRRRIVRLRLGAAPAAHNTGPVDASFTKFQQAFAAALRTNDTARLAELTRAPLRFNEIDLDQERVATLYRGAFGPAMQTGLHAATATFAADGGVQLACQRSMLVFRKDEAGAWRFAELRIR